MSDNTDSAKLKRVGLAATEAHADLPVRVWVEGDGKMYGQFQSNNGQRVRINEFEAIKLIHKAQECLHRIMSTAM